MRKLSTLAVLAALTLPVAGMAFAEDAAVKAGAKLGTDATTTGSVSSENFGTLISTLQAGKGLTDVSSISADANVTIVFVSKVEGGGDLKALDNALSKNADATSTLRTSLSANAALKAKLDAEKIKIEDVVAVTTAADGKVTVYVDDRA
jgi:citrate lyase beta subunit